MKMTLPDGNTVDIVTYDSLDALKILMSDSDEFPIEFSETLMNKMDALEWLCKGEFKHIDCDLWDSIVVLALWIWSYHFEDDNDFVFDTYPKHYVVEIIQAYSLYV